MTAPEAVAPAAHEALEGVLAVLRVAVRAQLGDSSAGRGLAVEEILAGLHDRAAEGICAGGRSADAAFSSVHASIAVVQTRCSIKKI